MRIHRPENKDSSFNSLLPLHSTDVSHSSPPTFISAWKGQCVYVCVYEEEEKLMEKIYKCPTNVLPMEILPNGY